jgi:carbonic anhydrase
MSTPNRLAFFTAILALSVASALVRGQSPEFTYSGAHGPAHWSETPGWEACGTAGTRQSPIAIDHVVVDRALHPLQLDARPTPEALINNGHTVEEEYEAGSTLTLDGVRFELAQFHFHSPSEHTVHGKHAALELHAVFNDPASMRKVVIAQLFATGASSPFLADLLSGGLPRKIEEKITAPRQINVAGAFVDLAHYYTYDGSLTTPPCTETVTWFVLQREGHLSKEQATAFHQVLGDDARPVQHLNHRTVRATPEATSE